MYEYVLAPDQDVVISSRVRLSRNYEDLPFSPKLTPEYAEEVIERTADAVFKTENGAAFTLEAGSASNEYTSRTVDGTDGVIAILYPKVAQEYTLTETTAPAGWQGIQAPIKFQLDHNGTVTVTTDNGEEWYILDQATESAPAIICWSARPIAALPKPATPKAI